MAVLGTPEIIIIVVVVVMLFGATQLPKLARSLGASAKEFRKGVHDGEEEAESPSEKKSQAPGTSAQMGPAPSMPAGATGQTVAQQLQTLAELRASGALTDDEFEAQKRKLLSSS
jgi:sec-independent protein translocase protein TatA